MLVVDVTPPAGGRILRLRDLVDMCGETLPSERHAEFEFGKK